MRCSKFIAVIALVLFTFNPMNTEVQAEGQKAQLYFILDMNSPIVTYF